MSLLEQLNKSKIKLKHTSTTVTRADGRRYLEDQCNGKYEQTLQSSTIGFVIDTKPDPIPALILPKLYLGSQDCLELNILNEYKISNILSIGIEPFKKYRNFNYKFVECLDLPETNIVEIIKLVCLPFIEGSFNKNENILIHCNAGCSRSPTVVIGYLILKLNYTFNQAFDLVKKARSCIQPNEGFLKQLKQL